MSLSIPGDESDAKVVTSSASNMDLTDSADADSGIFLHNKHLSSISYGFASSSNYTHRNALSACSEGTVLSTDEGNTQQQDDDCEEENEVDETSQLMFIASSAKFLLPKDCKKLHGASADKFIESLPSKHFERLKKFIETSEPKDDEHYVWIRDNTTAQVTVLSLQTLLNHIKNPSIVKRVKWRHLSFDRITVYRYSVASIVSAKQPNTFLYFIRNHQRYLIIILWITIVLLLGASILLGSLYSSNVQQSNTTQTSPLNYSRYFNRY